MFGNFDRDPDRFSEIRRMVCEFLQSLDLEYGRRARLWTAG